MKKIVSLLLCCMMLFSFAYAETDTAATEYMTAFLFGEDIQAQYDLLNDQMKSSVSLESFSAIKAQVLALGGELTGAGAETVTAQNGMALHSVTLQMININLDCIVGFDADGKIGTLWVNPVKKETAANVAVNLPENVTEIEVTVDAGTGYPLGGTLTMPTEGDNLPAIVLVHGSGPNDRDETVGQTKMFRDLAYALAARGMAVLRYDKRTYVYGAQMTQDEVANLTVEEETVQDAIAAGKLLAGIDRINENYVFVCGHSMGAMLAPRIAEEADGLFCGMILLSGSPNSLAQIIYDQNAAVLEAYKEQMGEETYKSQCDMLNDMWQTYLSLDHMTAEEQKNTTVFGVSGYYLATMKENAVERIKSLELPVMIICGGADFQVMDTNGMSAWAKAVKTNGIDNIHLFYHSELNHLLMEYQGDESVQYTTAEYDTFAQVSEEAVDDIEFFVSFTADEE